MNQPFAAVRRIKLPHVVALLAIMGVSAVPAHSDPTTQPAASQPTTSPVKYTLNFKDVPLDTVLNYFSQSVGFEILADGPIDARITLISKQPVSADEAVSLLSSALKSNGFAVIREGRVLHIKSRDKAKHENVPVHFGADPTTIADSDDIITQVVPVANISAMKLKDDLSKIDPDADLTANEGSNSLIITDSSSSVRRFVEIVAQLDKQESTTSEVRIIQLKHANATETAKLISSFFKVPGAPGQQQNNQFNPGGQQPNQQPPSGASERHGVSVTAVADERTNTLIIMASKESLKSVDQIVAQLDTEAPNPAPKAVIRLYPLKFAAADATARLINDLFKSSQNPSFLELLFGEMPSDEDQHKIVVTAESDDRTNTVIVTAPLECFKEIEALIHQLDTSPMVTQDYRVIHLRHGDATNVAKLVMDTFEPKKPAENNNDEFPIIFISPESMSQQPVHGLHINVTADERTNTILIAAPTEMLDPIARVVRDIDSDPTTEDTMFIYHLRNAQASHLGYTLNVLFGNVSQIVQAYGQNNQSRQQYQQNEIGQQGQSQSNSSPDQSNGGGNNGQNSNGNGGNPSGGGQRVVPGLSPGVLQAINALNGQALFVPEPDTNSLLVTVASKYEDQVRRIIEDLDHPVPQVLIKVLIAEVSRDNSTDVGVDYSVLNLRASGNGQEGVQTFGAPGTGLVVSILEDNLKATIHALETDGRLDVLSRPYILASDNQLASITVGQSVPFITESRLDTENNTINTVQYQDIGVILNVTPHINPGGSVILDVAPEISSLTNQNIQLSANVNSPVFQRRAANSRINVLNNQTIVIGGLMQDQNTTTINKLPILGDIPILGLLFQRAQVDKTKTELLIFLTPHVAEMPQVLQPMSDDERRGTVLTTQAVEPGVFEEHMRGMQRGAVPLSPTTQPSSPINSIPLVSPSDNATN
jgi:type II secretion system protein D